MPADRSRRRFLKHSAFAGAGAALGAAGLNAISPLIWKRPLPLEPNDSYWAKSRGPPDPALTEDLSVDVAIVGGGLTGLSSAHFIRRASPHKRVVVLEGSFCGSGASGRNGAMLLTMTADRYMNFSPDPSMDKRVYDLTVGNIRFLASLGAATGIDCESETNGALQVLGSAADRNAARAYVRQARLLGMPVEYWEAPRIAGAVGTAAYEGAFYDPNCGQIHPMKLVNALKAAAASAGATIFEHTVVQAVEEGRQHLLHTDGGRTVKAKSLVLATNAFTPRLGFLRNSVLPLHEYVAITEPVDEEQLTRLGWLQRIPINDSRTEVFYLGLTRDRRIHIGGGTPRYAFDNGPGNAGVDRFHVAQLQRELGRLYPGLSGTSFAQAWNGVVDWSLDASPSVGTTGRHQNVFYGLGYSGHGVNLTSLFGRIIADLEAGRGDSWTPYPFVNNRLYYVPNEPFRWVAAQSALAWYELTES
jgi:glycine/D-amino acid oxidase-like deaminating enzyme